MDFKNIPKNYRPIPFWSWNDKLDPEETREQVHKMNDAGMGGFFMHARGGLQTTFQPLSILRTNAACTPGHMTKTAGRAVSATAL